MPIPAPIFLSDCNFLTIYVLSAIFTTDFLFPVCYNPTGLYPVACINYSTCIAYDIFPTVLYPVAFIFKWDLYPVCYISY